MRTILGRTARGAIIAVFLAASVLVVPARADDIAILQKQAEKDRALYAAKPDDMRAAYRALLSTVGMGDVDQGLVLAKAIVRVVPDMSLARTTLAVDAMARNDFAAAREHFAKTKVSPAGDLIVTVLNSWLRLDQGHDRAVLDEMATYRDKFPNAAPEMALQEALMADLVGDGARAETLYRLALEKKSIPLAVDAYGRFLERAGQVENASQLYEKYRALTTTAEIAQDGLARIAAHKKPERRVASRRDGLAELLLSFGDLFDQPNTLHIAAVFTTLALHIRPDFTAAKARQVVLLGQMRAWVLCTDYTADEAIASCTSLMAAPALNENGKALLSKYRSVAKLKHGDDAGALEDITLALVSLPKDWVLLNDRGTIYLRLHQYSLAIADFDAALALYQSSGALFNNRGLANFHAKNYEEARKDFNRALAISPNNVMALTNRGRIAVAVGDYMQAHRDFEAALRIDPKSAATYLWRAELRHQEGDEAGASADMEMAQKLEPQILEREWSTVRGNK